MTDHTRVSPIRALDNRLPIPIAALVLSGLATLTISLALVLHANGFATSTVEGGSTIDFASNPTYHWSSLLLIAVVWAGFGYAVAHSDDPLGYVKGGLVGVGIALYVIFAQDGWSGILQLFDTLTLRPAFTGIALLFAIGYFAALYTRYDWIVINFAGLLIVPPIIALKGASIALPKLGGLLIITAVFDYLAVHKSNTMQNLAESMFRFRLPVAYFGPPRGASLADAFDAASTDENEDAVFNTPMLGMGDVAIPGMFIVGVAATTTSPFPIVCTLCGYLVGYAAIIYDPFDLSMYAALPFLNTGVLVGFAIAFPFA